MTVEGAVRALLPFQQVKTITPEWTASKQHCRCLSKICGDSFYTMLEYVLLTSAVNLNIYIHILKKMCVITTERIHMYSVYYPQKHVEF